MKARSRPYLSSSIDQLEATLEGAIARGDAIVIERIQHELTFRRVPRARDLADRIASGSLKRRPANKTSSSAPTRTPPDNRSAKQRSAHKPTAEQEAALDAFATEGSVRINAFAGAGKTSTLQMLAHATSRRGQYIAFNRSIVADAKTKFPSSVNCSTTHGLAFRATSAAFRQCSEKMTGKISAQKLAEVLEIKKTWRIDDQHVLPPRSLAYLILDTVRRYGQSGDEEISDAHVPRHGSLLSASEETLAQVNDFARKGAEHVWARMRDPNDPLPLGHDGYLKLWALSRPQIAADFILLDEAQDTNPVVLDVLRNQSAQLVYVGDQYQQIYEWRGAINAMSAMTTDHSVALSQSFRFGPEIAEAATSVLSRLGERLPLLGNPKLNSRVGPCNPNAILARTNASIMSELVEALNQRKKTHLVGGASELIAMLRGVEELKAGSPTAVPDFFGFSNWREVVQFSKTQEGQHLQTFVNLVETIGEKQLMWALNRTVDETEAEIILSTAHKAKGREWSKVRLTEDFLVSRRSRGDAAKNATDAHVDDQAAELRLFYVAMTRAREVIDIPSDFAAKLGLTVREVPQPPSAKRATARQPAAEPVPAWIPPVDWQAPTPVATTTAQDTSRPQQSAPVRPQPARRPRGLLDWIFGTR